MSELYDLANDAVSSFHTSYENNQFMIGNKNMREINQYDLDAMVKLFYEDCKTNNINAPEIVTLNATFKSLESNKIALS